MTDETETLTPMGRALLEAYRDAAPDHVEWPEELAAAIRQALATIAAAQRELERLRAKHSEDLRFYRKQLQEAEHAALAAKNALICYGAHEHSCAGLKRGARQYDDCSCGFADALAGLPGATEAVECPVCGDPTFRIGGFCSREHEAAGKGKGE